MKLLVYCCENTFTTNVRSHKYCRATTTEVQDNPQSISSACQATVNIGNHLWQLAHCIYHGVINRAVLMRQIVALQYHS